MARSWWRRPDPDLPAAPPAESFWTILARAMSSFGCAARLVFVLCSVMVVSCACVTVLLLVLKWVGLTAALSAAEGSGGVGATVVAGTGLAAPLVALLAVLVRGHRR